MKAKPTLQPAEIEAVKQARTDGLEMVRLILPSGSYVAMAGKARLFCTGSAESFESLWRDAEDCYAKD